eukprot:2232570-Rhodomonas_salina.5
MRTMHDEHTGNDQCTSTAARTHCTTDRMARAQAGVRADTERPSTAMLELEPGLKPTGKRPGQSNALKRRGPGT